MKKKALLSSIVLALVFSITACVQSSKSESSYSRESSISSSSEQVISSVSSSSEGSSSSESQVLTSSEEQENSTISSEISSSSSSESSSSQICEHSFSEKITKEATIVKKGIKRLACEKCGYYKEEGIYDLDEFVFEDKTFMYDGHERELFIEGMLPYGTTVTYEDNKLTEIGDKTAKANIYDEKGQLLLTKTAKLSIIENIGLANLKVNTTSGEEPDYRDKTNYTSMRVYVDNCADKYAINGASGGIRGRGNSTNYDVVSKHPWRLKFDSKINLLGLHKGQKFKSWVLLAEYFDQSMFRNVTAFNFGNALFNYSHNYASDYQFVNFYMNDEYRGVYVLAEQQQVNENRINVKEPTNNNQDEKVGYLLEIDIRGGDDDPYFTAGPQSTRSPSGVWSGGIMINGVRVVSSNYAIKSEILLDKQKTYIQRYISNAMSALIAMVRGEKLQIVDEDNNLVDSPYDNQYDTLNSFIDVESFFKMYVVQELMKNYDVGYGSFYLYVDFSANSQYPRLTFGAPWDFDLSSGNKQSGNIVRTEGDFIKAGFGEANFNPWLYLLSQTDFYETLIKKYYSVFHNSSIFEKTIAYINYASSAFANEFVNNDERWKDGTGKERMSTRQYSSQSAAVTYLVNWLTQRKQYMDGAYL